MVIRLDFEKKGKRETCPVLEQFLCHVAKTGQPMISWSQFKTYFMFKLEKVMDDFHASTPEQRGLHNPNVEYIPFEEMKKRILKIVDGYNGIPFTIQRLCELLTDPKRNYTGTDKFLRGLEKNVMVVSCVYPSSEKNGASSVNRMNGVMFPGNSSLYSDSRNVNGPGTPKPLTRPKLSLSTSLSTNGLPDSPISREPEPTKEEVEEHFISESSLSEGAVTPNSGIKNKHPEEEEDSDADKQEVKRLKFDKKEREDETSEEKESSCHQGPESLSETPESSKDSCGEEYKSEPSCDAPSISDDRGKCEFLLSLADVCFTDTVRLCRYCKSKQPLCNIGPPFQKSIVTTEEVVCTQKERTHMYLVQIVCLFLLPLIYKVNMNYEEKVFNWGLKWSLYTFQAVGQMV
uniref:Serine/threonine-protein phosphatase 4 regulatory subunit 2 n=1 Tax=Amphiprion ocellaris TaxID=80972 RepID=A0AAQ5XII2_AMPOC